jgi:hypothetical protein
VCPGAIKTLEAFPCGLVIVFVRDSLPRLCPLAPNSARIVPKPAPVRTAFSYSNLRASRFFPAFFVEVLGGKG